MYSYQHKYHAGNFADLHKHITLIAILKYLQNKSTPYCVIDAFAGDGIYDLTTSESQKNKEYLTGYGLLHNLKKYNIFFEYLANISGEEVYPGSPAVIKSLLRGDDRAIFIENHPGSYKSLVRNFSNIKNINIYKRDSYEALNALITFKERRGVVLIDPSYEVKTEYKRIIDLITKIYSKNKTCIYIIWYPVLNHNQYYDELIKALDNSVIPNDKVWHNRLTPVRSYNNANNHNDPVMTASGLIVINVPWKLDVTLKQCFLEINKV